METEILLESGTNEIEIMQFTILGDLYGINVAKVKEIMMSQEVKPIPHSHPCVEGIYKPRNEIMTVIDLTKFLKGEPTKREGRDIFIIASFNQINIAFHVESVQFISRISWKDIQRADSTISRGEEGVTTGIAQCDGKLVTVLDFEKIVTEIAPETGINLNEVEALGKRSEDTSPIVIAEDSSLLAEMLKKALNAAGYSKLSIFANGQLAWDYLSEIARKGEVSDKVKLVITDIEMPQMDGHRLTKLIKDSPELKSVPVIIFSSLINDEMRKKGAELGVDAQLSKPEIGLLIKMVDNLLNTGDKKHE